MINLRIYIFFLLLPISFVTKAAGISFSFYSLNNQEELSLMEVEEQNNIWTEEEPYLMHDGGNITRWYKVEVSSKSNSIYYLTVEVPIFNTLQIYEKSNLEKGFKNYNCSIGVTDGIEIDQEFGVPIQFKEGEQKVFYFKIQSYSTFLSSKIDFVTPNTYQDNLENKFLFKQTSRVIICGLLFLAALLGVISSLRIYLYNLIGIFGAIIFAESEIGYFLTFLSGENEIFIYDIRIIGNGLFVIFSTVFNYKIIFSENQPIPKDLKIIIALQVVLTIIVLIVQHFILVENVTLRLLVQMSISLALLNFILNIRYIYIGCRQKIPAAKIAFFCYVSTVLLLTFFVSMPHLGILPHFLAIDYVYYMILTFDTGTFFLLLLQFVYSKYRQKSILELEEQQLLQQYSKAIIKGKEKERIRIGRELHDFVGGNLSLINKAQNLSQEEIKEILKMTATEVEELSQGLMKEEMIDKVTFETLFFNLVERFHTEKMHCFVQFEGEDFDSIPPVFINQLYRISQELLSNAKKHSMASLLIIVFKIDTRKNKLSIHYNDNGIGLPVEKSKTKGMGMMNITNRVKEIGGYLTITSNTGGTNIIISEISL
ncbi:ATP-binding protein [Flammeovirga sp. SubArs3]|uniref:sensor histidine kinase n=1 Tax=Flammeovirga sp. SubArs3 TaxID=2995316 RepID=UPI00248AA554|nr:ATP-binding protein [Flammeovirga sp. SubArs3]